MEVEQELSKLVECYLATLDQDAAEALVRRFQTMVVAVVARHVPPTDIEEVTQEVFLDFFRGLPRLREYATVSGFLRRIALRRVCDYWRYRSQDPLNKTVAASDRKVVLTGDSGVGQIVDMVADPTPNSEAQIIARDWLKKAIATLPPRTQAVVRLAFVEGESAKEIARILDITPLAAKVEIFRSRRRLRKLLEGLAPQLSALVTRSLLVMLTGSLIG